MPVSLSDWTNTISDGNSSFLNTLINSPALIFYHFLFSNCSVFEFNTRASLLLTSLSYLWRATSSHASFIIVKTKTAANVPIIEPGD
jgi:hypothetical protein